MADWVKESYRAANIEARKAACSRAGIAYSENEETIFEEFAELDVDAAFYFAFELEKEELERAHAAELESLKLTDLPDLGF
jgi:hypothetical protein